MRWFGAVTTLELRRLISYRADFWMLFFGGTVAQMGLAYFLWKAVFDVRGRATLNGFDLHSLVFYYLLVALTDRLVRGSDTSFASRDIYDGSLTRYLLYPISFVGYRYAILLGGLVLSLVQALFGVGLFAGVLGIPDRIALSLAGVAGGLFVVLAAGTMHFFLTLALEFLAFWVDNVWSLLALLRFVVYLLGGGMVPLEFFPGWARGLLFWTPFPHIFSTPIALWSGRLAPIEAVAAVGVLAVWGALFCVVAMLLWRSGQKRYTGVGI